MMTLSLIVQFWFLVALVCVIVEAGHPGLLYFLSFALGAVCTAGVAAYFPALSGTEQAWIFLGSSIICLIIMHGIRRFIFPVKEVLTTHVGQHSNVDALIGKKVVVIKNEQAVMLVRVGGETWRAQSVHGQTVSAGDLVIIKNVIGTQLVVEKVST